MSENGMRNKLPASLQAEIIRQLDQDNDNLSPDVGRKLYMNRQAILAKYSEQGLVSRLSLMNLLPINWKPVLVFAFSFALLTGLVFQFSRKQQTIDPDVIELLVADEQLEMFEQLEFIEWLTEQEKQQDESRAEAHQAQAANLEFS